MRQGAVAVLVAGVVVLVIVLVSQPTKPKKSATTTTTTTTTTTSTTTTTQPQAAVAPVCPPATGSAKRETNFTHAPPICITAGTTYYATVATDVGAFVIELPSTDEPRAVNNFVFLARYRFYNGVVFHRVIPRFVVQGGDPTGTGNGGPGYHWTGNEPPSSCSAARNCYAPYEVAYANSATPSSNGSQFFIVLPGGQDSLQPDYTLFGKVVAGQSVINKIAADGSSSGVPKVKHTMTSVTISTKP